MEEAIKSMLEKATKGTGVKVLTEPLPDVFPSITFHLYGESGSLYAKGKATEETVNCQIDVWYKAKKESVKAAIKSIKSAIVEGNYYTHPTITTVYETGTKLYHTYLEFECVVSE